jgi:DNA invertase Pin-like site-specific DNA recombinase
VGQSRRSAGERTDPDNHKHIFLRQWPVGWLVLRVARGQLRKAIVALTEGDTLIVTRLDQLARSTRDLLNILATIADNGAGFKSLGDAWADTTTPHGRLMLTVLVGLAEFERELIKARTSEVASSCSQKWRQTRSQA